MTALTQLWAVGVESSNCHKGLDEDHVNYGKLPVGADTDQNPPQKGDRMLEVALGVPVRLPFPDPLYELAVMTYKPWCNVAANLLP